MSGFIPLEGDSVLIVDNGVYRQVDLYERNGQLFAKHGSGFVRLTKDGGSSKQSVSFKELIYDGPLYHDAFGRLCVQDGDGRKSLISVPGALPLPKPEKEV